MSGRSPSSSTESSDQTKYQKALPHSPGSGERNKKRGRSSGEVQEGKRQKGNNSSKSKKSGPSTNTPKKKFKRQPRESSPSASEETPDWAKRMTARFKVLETHNEEIQIKMDTRTRTIKELRSAINNQQGTPSTDED